MRFQRAVLQKPTRKLPEKGFPLAPSWCHPPEGRAQAPWSPPAQSHAFPPLPTLAAGRSPSSCWGRRGRRFTASAFPPRGSLRELRAVEALAIFARCLQSSSRAELSPRSRGGRAGGAAFWVRAPAPFPRARQRGYFWPWSRCCVSAAFQCAGSRTAHRASPAVPFGPLSPARG